MARTNRQLGILDELQGQSGNNVVGAAETQRKMGVVLSGAAIVDIQFAPELNGSPAVATLNETDGTLVVLRCVWQGAGVLRVTLSGNATGDRDVAAFAGPVTV